MTHLEGEEVLIKTVPPPLPIPVLLRPPLKQEGKKPGAHIRRRASASRDLMTFQFHREVWKVWGLLA